MPTSCIDYSILKPDRKTQEAWRARNPLPKATVKRWNEITRNTLRSHSVALGLETKAPNKTWTDGEPQLGIWITLLLNCLRRLTERQCRSLTPDFMEDLGIPARPLLIAHGNDRHLLIVSHTCDSAERRIIIWRRVGRKHIHAPIITGSSPSSTSGHFVQTI